MSMPKVMLKRRGLPQGSVIEYESAATIETHHSHVYHGSKCPMLTSPDGKCLVTVGAKSCLDPCIFHGQNCQIGVCLECWLYDGKKTIHHFLPTLPKKRGPRKKKWKK